MHSDVIVSFGPDDDRTFHVEAMRDPVEARAWLDEQFIELDCEPPRASGKVLLADKLLAVAAAAGTKEFADAAWANQFARAAAGATGRGTVRIDVPTRTVNY